MIERNDLVATNILFTIGWKQDDVVLAEMVLVPLLMLMFCGSST